MHHHMLLNMGSVCVSHVIYYGQCLCIITCYLIWAVCAYHHVT